MNVVGIIPARYNSTRLPGKPLEMIGEKSLVMHVYDRCRKVRQFSALYVATDDERIAEHVNRNGGKSLLTSPHHSTGTERCFEALGKIDGHFDFVVNIQGDEPFINPDHIRILIESLSMSTEVATLCMPVTDEKDLDDAGVPKVVKDNKSFALYFSRSVIPFLREPTGNRLSEFRYLRHIGIYAYHVRTLATIVGLEPSSLEKAEKLEQLRWISHGVRISAIEILPESTISVDTRDDLERARKMISQQS